MTSPGELLATLVRRASAQTHRHQRAAELDDELAFHAELLERELRAGGMSERDARNAARRQLGNRTRIQEEARDSWSFDWIEDALRQLRLAIRAARKSLGYSLTVVLTLALGSSRTRTLTNWSRCMSTEPRGINGSSRIRRCSIGRRVAPDSARCRICEATT